MLAQVRIGRLAQRLQALRAGWWDRHRSGVSIEAESVPICPGNARDCRREIGRFPRAAQAYTLVAIPSGRSAWPTLPSRCDPQGVTLPTPGSVDPCGRHRPQGDRRELNSDCRCFAFCNSPYARHLLAGWSGRLDWRTYASAIGPQARA